MKKSAIFKGILCLLIVASVFGAAKFAVSSIAAGEDFELKWIIPPNNYLGQAFSEGRAWVQKEKDGAWALYDIDGNIIKDGFKAKLFSHYEGDFARFEDENGKVGFLNLSGDIIVPPIISYKLASLREDLITERDEESRLYGFVNIHREWVIPAAYESINAFNEGLAAVKKEKGGKWGYIDKNGAVVIDFLFDRVAPFFNRAAIVSQNAMNGMIDSKGNFIVEPQYHIYRKSFSFDVEKIGYDPIGLAKDNKVGFINTSGDIVIDFKFKFDKDRMQNIFSNGRAVVTLDEKGSQEAVIDESGNIVFRIGRGIQLLRNIYYDDYIVGRNGEEIILFDKNGNSFNLRPYIDFNYIISSSSNIFRVDDPKRKKIQFGYFKIIPKGEHYDG